jgi:GNAT superfamily N-acetyltransferase
MVQVPDGVEFTLLDSDQDSVLEEIRALLAAARAVDTPGDLGATVGEVRRWAYSPPGSSRRTVLARLDGRVVGCVHVRLPAGEAGEGSGELWVHPRARRRGIGRLLFRRAMAVTAEACGRTFFLTGPDTASSRAFAGDAPLVQRTRQYSLDLDRADLLSLVEVGRRRRPASFGTVAWENGCPPDRLEDYVGLLNALDEDEPSARGGALRVTADDVRNYEQAIAAIGQAEVVMAGMDRTTGTLVGSTGAFLWDCRRVELVNTVILPAYRGQRLTSWLEAEILSFVRSYHPTVGTAVIAVATDNAPMMRAVARLGFIAVGDYVTYSHAIVPGE